MISFYRLNEKKGFGVPDDPKSSFTKWSRSHVTHCEYVPTMLAFLLYGYLKTTVLSGSAAGCGSMFWHWEQHFHASYSLLALLLAQHWQSLIH